MYPRRAWSPGRARLDSGRLTSFSMPDSKFKPNAITTSADTRCGAAAILYKKSPRLPFWPDAFSIFTLTQVEHDVQLKNGQKCNPFFVGHAPFKPA